MSARRHCIFYPTPKGWYLELAGPLGGGVKDSSTYGPTHSLVDMEHFLSYDLRGQCRGKMQRKMRTVPAVSPNGSPVEAITLDHRSGWEDAFGAPKPRFFTSKDDVQNYVIFDTLTDMGFTVPRVSTPNPRQIQSVFGGHAWRRSAPMAIKPCLIPASGPEWAAFIKETATAAVMAGWQYDPVIIPGLPRQPLPPLALSFLLS